MITADVIDNLRDLEERLFLTYRSTEGDIESRIEYAKVQLVRELIAAFGGNQ